MVKEVVFFVLEFWLGHDGDSQWGCERPIGESMMARVFTLMSVIDPPGVSKTIDSICQEQRPLTLDQLPTVTNASTRIGVCEPSGRYDRSQNHNKWEAWCGTPYGSLGPDSLSNLS